MQRILIFLFNLKESLLGLRTVIFGLLPYIPVGIEGTVFWNAIRAHCCVANARDRTPLFLCRRPTKLSSASNYRLSTYLLITASIFFNLAHAADRQALVFLCSNNNAPMTYQENGQTKGMLIDILQALGKKIDRRIDVQLADLKEAQKLVLDGKADALCQMNISDSRKSPFEFSDPFMTQRFSIFSRSNSGYFSDLSDLRGLQVGATAGSLPWTLLEKDPQIKLVSINDYKEGFQMLKDGKLDAIFGDNWVGSYVLEEEGIVEVRANDDSIAKLKSAIALKKGNTALRDEINEGLKALKADGTLGRIYDNWRPKEVVHETREQAQKKNYSIAIAGFGLLLLIAFIWVFSLRREVAVRKRSEVLAERERIRLGTILRTASDGIHIMNGEGVLVEANEAFLNMLGYDKSAIGQLDFSDWLVQDKSDAQKISIKELLKQRSRFVFETRYRRKDDVILDVEISATGIEFEGEEFIYAASRDITKRKLAEQQLLIAATAFESQEGMYITDAKQMILRVNKAFTTITGFTEEEAIGQNPGLLSSGRHSVEFYKEMVDKLIEQFAWQGEVFHRRKSGDIFPAWLTITAVKADDDQVTNYVATITDITERKRAENEINVLAFYDPLTSLPNRRLLYDRLKQIQSSSSRIGKYAALLLIDLDNFKTLNDTHGHDYGDILLQQIAKNLTACVRKGDTVARLGGDEFVLILKDLKSDKQEAANLTEAIARKILSTISGNYQLGNIEHRSGASIGATMFIGSEVPMDDLLKQADLAMYKTKETGRNNVHFFDPKMQTVVRERANLETAMRKGIEGNHFLLHYQAQVNSLNHVIGTEALLRWQHPLHGLKHPHDFIPLAEETGLILPLGYWVLETACVQLATWESNPDLKDLSVSVNISARQLRETSFVDKVLKIIERTGANPKKLKLEITESQLVDNLDAIIKKMGALKATGIGIALDDFGTGYSSLSYLKRLPLDQLKIDQSFVHDLMNDFNDAAIAKTIVTLAESMGLEVISEGVETEAQKESLEKLGCHIYQGFLFSKPLPLDEFELYVLQARLISNAKN